jgi:hypothetical protein
MRVEPVGFGRLINIPEIKKSPKSIAKKISMLEKREKEAWFLEKEADLRNSFPEWLGHHVNLLV